MRTRSNVTSGKEPGKIDFPAFTPEDAYGY